MNADSGFRNGLWWGSGEKDISAGAGYCCLDTAALSGVRPMKLKGSTDAGILDTSLSGVVGEEACASCAPESGSGRDDSSWQLDRASGWLVPRDRDGRKRSSGSSPGPPSFGR